MINFIVVKANGQILRSGTCPSEDQAMLQKTEDTEIYITEVEGILPNTHYYDEGIVVIPPSPGSTFQFDYTSKSWIDPRSLDSLRQAQWEAIKAQRDIGEMAPFTYKNFVLDGDLNAQRRLMVLISISKGAIAAGQEFSNEFTLADNSVTTFTAEDFVAIEMAKAMAVDAVFTKARQLRDQINSASKEQISTIIW